MTSDIMFPPPPPVPAGPIAPSGIKKYIPFISHLAMFLAGFIGGGKTHEIIRGAGEVIGQLNH